MKDDIKFSEGTFFISEVGSIEVTDGVSTVHIWSLAVDTGDT